MRALMRAKLKLMLINALEIMNIFSSLSEPFAQAGL
jgi:hypothetical protein